MRHRESQRGGAPQKGPAPLAGVSGRHSYRMTLAESETRFCRYPPDIIFSPFRRRLLPGQEGEGAAPSEGRSVWDARGSVERVFQQPASNDVL